MLPTDFIFGTKVQPNKSHSMTQMLMILTKGQGHLFPKMGKKSKNWSYLGGYLSTDFILGTNVQPNKAHSMTQGQGQRSRSNFPKNDKKKPKQLAISRRLFHLQTSY